MRGSDHFTKLGLETNPELRVFVQASWPAHDGRIGQSFQNEMRDAITEADLKAMEEGYRTSWLMPLEAQVAGLNEEVGRTSVFIVPVSQAVFALRKHVIQGTAPGLTSQSELFRDSLDMPHPPLAALVAYCHFAAIHGRNPAGMPVPPGLEGHPDAAELSALLQQIAWEAVSGYPMSGVEPGE